MIWSAPSILADDAEGAGPVLSELHHDRLAQQIAAEEHPVADFIVVQMPGQGDFGERRRRV